MQRTLYTIVSLLLCVILFITVGCTNKNVTQGSNVRPENSSQNSGDESGDEWIEEDSNLN